MSDVKGDQTRLKGDLQARQRVQTLPLRCKAAARFSTQIVIGEYRSQTNQKKCSGEVL